LFSYSDNVFDWDAESFGKFRSVVKLSSDVQYSAVLICGNFYADCVGLATDTNRYGFTAP
jgi:hypothetical protein